MNARDETDMDGDERLINAFRELSKVPTFSLGEEIARLTEPQREWARMADERCPSCGRLGFRYRCPTCERS